MSSALSLVQLSVHTALKLSLTDSMIGARAGRRAGRPRSL